jgi:hypothetical protein
MGDHFLIGNGDGLMDGEIQIGQRWNRQQGALPPAGARFGAAAGGAIVSIALVGDFDKTVPTPTQLRRLNQLVGTLQGELRISAGNVLVMDTPRSAAGIGRYFPKSGFRAQLLP